MRLQSIFFLFFGVFFVVSIGCKQSSNEPTQKEGKSSSAKEDSMQKAALKVSALEPRDSLPSFYITFDDGPYHTTPIVTSYLKKKNLKTSFFNIGSQIAHSGTYDSLFKDERATPLFKNYNHTFSHAVTGGRIKSYYSHPDRVWEDICKNKVFLDSQYAITRLPGNNTWRINDYKKGSDKNSRNMFAYLDSIGSKEILFGWDFTWFSKHSKDSAAVSSLLSDIDKTMKLRGSKNNDYVILFHDYYFHDQAAIDKLDYLITELSKRYRCHYRWAEEYPGVVKQVKP